MTCSWCAEHSPSTWPALQDCSRNRRLGYFPWDSSLWTVLHRRSWLLRSVVPREDSGRHRDRSISPPAAICVPQSIRWWGWVECFLYLKFIFWFQKAESFGGMANGLAHGCYETSVPMLCQTPPSVMVHHHHHHAHVPQHATAPYTGYQVFDEMSMPSPNYQPVPEQAMCSPGGTYYEYVPQQYTRPVRYVTDYQQRRPQSANVQYMYGPPQYVQYPQMVHPEVEVYVDPVQAQPFPPVSHFVVPSNDPPQGYASSHQAETASSFIKVNKRGEEEIVAGDRRNIQTSIDGGYGSMNQEPDAITVEKAENSSNAGSSQ